MRGNPHKADFFIGWRYTFYNCRISSFVLYGCLSDVRALRESLIIKIKLLSIEYACGLPGRLHMLDLGPSIIEKPVPFVFFDASCGCILYSVYLSTHRAAVLFLLYSIMCCLLYRKPINHGVNEKEILLISDMSMTVSFLCFWNFQW